MSIKEKHKEGRTSYSTRSLFSRSKNPTYEVGISHVGGGSFQQNHKILCLIKEVFANIHAMFGKGNWFQEYHQNMH